MTEQISSQAGRQHRGGASIVMYQFGGRQYPLKAVAQCKVCQSPYRFEIENQIAAGRVFAMIARELLLTDPDSDINGDNVSAHYRNGHMPLEHEATRRIVESRAIQRGKDVERGVESLVDGISLAEVVVQKTFEAIQRGEIKPDLKDGLTAARLLETFAAEDDAVDASVYAEVFMVYHDVAQQVMTPSQFEEFGRRLQGNEVLKSLIAKHSGEQQPSEPVTDHDIEDAHVIEEGSTETLGRLDNGQG